MRGLLGSATVVRVAPANAMCLDVTYVEQRWRHAFNQAGLAALAPRWAGGRPPVERVHTVRLPGHKPDPNSKEGEIDCAKRLGGVCSRTAPSGPELINVAAETPWRYG